MTICGIANKYDNNPKLMVDAVFILATAKTSSGRTALFFCALARDTKGVELLVYHHVPGALEVAAALGMTSFISKYISSVRNAERRAGSQSARTHIAPDVKQPTLSVSISEETSQ
eukprot:m.127718 g.127718  ORF g.127718 m.127718 type:complete len:115 (-) comp13854_c0_seq8:368-712(-)